MESIIERMKNLLDEEKTRSAWGRGIKEYAAELVDDLAATFREHFNINYIEIFNNFE